MHKCKKAFSQQAQDFNKNLHDNLEKTIELVLFNIYVDTEFDFYSWKICVESKKMCFSGDEIDEILSLVSQHPVLLVCLVFFVRK